MTDRPVEIHERRILGTELLWAFGVGVLIAATLSVIVFTALTRDINPPSNVERIDPKTLHLSGEFAEHNEHDADVLDRVVGARLQVAARLHPEAEPPVTGEQIEHVVEESDAGFGAGFTAVQVEYELDLNLTRLAFLLSAPTHDKILAPRSRRGKPEMDARSALIV